MSSRNGAPYELPKLAGIRSRSLSLGVPVLRGSVHIGLDGYTKEEMEDIKERLAITIEPPEIRIAREDGQPLHITDVFGSRPRPVLVDPVPELVLRQHQGDVPGLYDVHGEGVRIYDRESMHYFLGLIETFADKKEFDAQTAEGTLAAARVLATFVD